MRHARANFANFWRRILSVAAPVVLTGAAVIAPPQAAAETRVLFLGDSLTEGYGVLREEAYPALIAARLQQDGAAAKIINGGISGSTSASAPSRLRWHLKNARDGLDILVLALGANDGLRGLPPAAMKKNLLTAVAMAREGGARVLLAGMLAPPNFGGEYAGEFSQVFYDIAAEEEVAFMPFLLEDVAAVESLNLADGIHPNPAGHKVIAENVYAYLRPLLQKISGEKNDGQQ